MHDTTSYHDLRSIVSSPNWPIFKMKQAASGLVPILLAMGPDTRGIEVGVCWGINSYMLLESCPNITRIVGVDHYTAYKDWDREIQQHEQDHNFAKLKHNMEYMGPRFTLIKEPSVVAASELEDDAFDFVFLDADHNMRSVLNDLDSYWPKLRNGGIMAGHDSNLFGVNFAVTSWAKRRGIDPNSIASIANEAWWFTKEQA